jgi:hypothetical protein
MLPMQSIVGVVSKEIVTVVGTVDDTLEAIYAFTPIYNVIAINSEMANKDLEAIVFVIAKQNIIRHTQKLSLAHNSCTHTNAHAHTHARTIHAHTHTHDNTHCDVSWKCAPLATISPQWRL